MVCGCYVLILFTERLMSYRTKQRLMYWIMSMLSRCMRWFLNMDTMAFCWSLFLADVLKTSFTNTRRFTALKYVILINVQNVPAVNVFSVPDIYIYFASIFKTKLCLSLLVSSFMCTGFLLFFHINSVFHSDWLANKVVPSSWNHSWNGIFAFHTTTSCHTWRFEITECSCRWWLSHQGMCDS